MNCVSMIRMEEWWRREFQAKGKEFRKFSGQE